MDGPSNRVGEGSTPYELIHSEVSCLMGSFIRALDTITHPEAHAHAHADVHAARHHRCRLSRDNVPRLTTRRTRHTGTPAGRTRIYIRGRASILANRMRCADAICSRDSRGGTRDSGPIEYPPPNPGILVACSAFFARPLAYRVENLFSAHGRRPWSPRPND